MSEGLRSDLEPCWLTARKVGKERSDALAWIYCMGWRIQNQTSVMVWYVESEGMSMSTEIIRGSSDCPKQQIGAIPQWLIVASRFRRI